MIQFPSAIYRILPPGVRNQVTLAKLSFLSFLTTVGPQIVVIVLTIISIDGFFSHRVKRSEGTLQ
jgi:hypothetical protein